MFAFSTFAFDPFCTLPVGDVVVIVPEEGEVLPAGFALGPSQMFGTPDGRRRKRELDEAVAAMMRMLMER